MILNDKQIKQLAVEHEMIVPFINESIAKGISHGLNSFGYDLRCGSEFKIFTNIKGATADPKNFSEDNFITVKGEDSILIPPNSFALASSLEYFKMPRNVTGLVTDFGYKPDTPIEYGVERFVEWYVGYCTGENVN